MTHVVIPWGGMHVAPYRKGFHRDLLHGKEALVRQISYEGEEPPGHRVKSDWDGKQRVHEMQCSILV